MIYNIDIKPVGAVRQSRSEKWKPRPCTLRYRAYRDELRLKTPKKVLKALEEGDTHLLFRIETPASWSNKKKQEHIGQPHKQKPDVDNLCKGFFDALLEDDSHIFDVRISKIWSKSNGITVFIKEKDDSSQ